MKENLQKYDDGWKCITFIICSTGKGAVDPKSYSTQSSHTYIVFIKNIKHWILSEKRNFCPHFKKVIILLIWMEEAKQTWSFWNNFPLFSSHIRRFMSLWPAKQFEGLISTTGIELKCKIYLCTCVEGFCSWTSYDFTYGIISNIGSTWRYLTTFSFRDRNHDCCRSVNIKNQLNLVL